MGPSASSHGSPVPLPSDLSFRSPTPSNLPMVQLWAAHAHEGKEHAGVGRAVPSYLHLSHLEPPAVGGPLLSQLGQPSIFDTQNGPGTCGVRGGGWHRASDRLLAAFALSPGWLLFFF
uniref:Trinucleotide repeat containing 18 n=1 Tax=Rhinopithecus bieti TaxID=61621 RepID=A0A2K6K413_RHIBE